MSAKAMRTTTSTPVLLDWNALTEAAAFVELSRRVGVELRVSADGKLSASGNPETVRRYLSDIAARYRGAIIAYLLGLPAPDMSPEQDLENILAMSQTLDVTIGEYFQAVERTEEERERIRDARRRMAAVYLVQNVCLFRVWLFELRRAINEKEVRNV